MPSMRVWETDIIAMTQTAIVEVVKFIVLITKNKFNNIIQHIEILNQQMMITLMNSKYYIKQYNLNHLSLSKLVE